MFFLPPKLSNFVPCFSLLSLPGCHLLEWWFQIPFPRAPWVVSPSPCSLPIACSSSFNWVTAAPPLTAVLVSATTFDLCLAVFLVTLSVVFLALVLFTNSKGWKWIILTFVLKMNVFIFNLAKICYYLVTCFEEIVSPSWDCERNCQMMNNPTSSFRDI